MTETRELINCFKPVVLPNGVFHKNLTFPVHDNNDNISFVGFYCIFVTLAAM